MTRRRLTEREVIKVLIMQGATIPCYRTGKALELEDVVEREHKHEHGLDGPETLDNFAFSLKSAHDIVTNGTPATSAGSSKHRIAKAKRGERKRLGLGKKRSGPKLKARGFRKDLRKRFDGRVEKAE